jgi:hypothetical protein
LSLCLITQALCHEDVWGSGGLAQPFLTSALDGREWLVSRLCRFTPGERPPWYPLDRRLSEPQSRSGCGGEDKTLRCRKSKLGRPVRSQSLYRLCYFHCIRSNTYICFDKGWKFLITKDDVTHAYLVDNILAARNKQLTGIASLTMEMSGKSTHVTNSTQCINRQILCSQNTDNDSIGEEILNSLDGLIKISVHPNLKWNQRWSECFGQPQVVLPCQYLVRHTQAFCKDTVLKGLASYVSYIQIYFPVGSIIEAAIAIRHSYTPESTCLKLTGDTTVRAHSNSAL